MARRDSNPHPRLLFGGALPVELRTTQTHDRLAGYQWELVEPGPASTLRGAPTTPRRSPRDTPRGVPAALLCPVRHRGLEPRTYGLRVRSSAAELVARECERRRCPAPARSCVRCRRGDQPRVRVVSPVVFGDLAVDLPGFEPGTSALPRRRATNCATSPRGYRRFRRPCSSRRSDQDVPDRRPPFGASTAAVPISGPVGHDARGRPADRFVCHPLWSSQVVPCAPPHQGDLSLTQGRQGSNLLPPVLETGAQPVELHPYEVDLRTGKPPCPGLGGAARR